MEQTGSGTTAGDLRELVESLAKQRALTAVLKVKAGQAQVLAAATPAWAAWTAAQKDAADMEAAMKALERQVREQAIEVAVRDGTKEPAPGVNVVKLTIFAVTDNLKAAEWARTWAPLALLVNEDVLAKQVMGMAAGERPDIPGVKIEEREYGQVRIDRDLAPIYLKPKE